MKPWFAAGAALLAASASAVKAVRLGEAGWTRLGDLIGMELWSRGSREPLTARLALDFGERAGPLIADLGEHPEAWREAGVDVEAAALAVPEAYRGAYEEGRRRRAGADP